MSDVKLKKERFLALYIDDKNYIQLYPENEGKCSNYNLDTYIIKNFSGSEDIRKHYKEEIEQYLNTKKQYIKDKNITHINGDIIILEKKNDYEIEPFRIKILYKKHKVILKKVIENFYNSTEARKFFLELNYHYDIVPSNLAKIVKYNKYRSSLFTNTVKNWLKIEKWTNYNSFEDEYICDKIRLLFQAYLKADIKPTVKQLCKEYIEKHPKNKKTKLTNLDIKTIPPENTKIEKEETEFVFIDGVKYKKEEYENIFTSELNGSEEIIGHSTPDRLR